MFGRNRPPEGAAASPGRFSTTRWSLVLAVRQGEASEVREALSTLCTLYWYPLYAFVRRRGYGPEDAHDRVQGFFTQLLEKNPLAVPDPHRGRFRSWLLGSLKHYLSNERDRENALKRGGGQHLLSLEWGAAEARFVHEPVEVLTPERAYERRWAVTLLEHVLTLLCDEYHRAGRGALFDSLKGLLTGAAREASYQEIAESLDLSAGAVKVAAHRLRARYRALLREEIAQTVERAEDVDDELRLLLSSLE